MRLFPSVMTLAVCIVIIALFSTAIHAQDAEPPPEEPPLEEPAPEPEPEPEPQPLYDANLVDIFPKQITIGDSQLNLYVENTGNRPLKNLVAFVTGDGISTYDVIPIEELQPDQRSYIIVRINARHRGLVELTVRILDDTFERRIVVRDEEADSQEQQQKEEEERKRNRLATAGSLLANLTEEYDAVEEFYYLRKNQGYDISGIDLRDAKGYLREAQASYAKSDVEQTEASLVLLQSELSDLNTLLENSQKPTRTFGDWIKDNSTFVITVGYVLGIIISLFTIIELVKKNKQALREELAQQPRARSPHARLPIRSHASSGQKRKPKRSIRNRYRRPPKRPIPSARIRSRSAPRRTAESSLSKKYKMNRVQPTYRYTVQPADDG